jgi:hypothetical protein
VQNLWGIKYVLSWVPLGGTISNGLILTLALTLIWIYFRLIGDIS